MFSKRAILIGLSLFVLLIGYSFWHDFLHLPEPSTLLVPVEIVLIFVVIVEIYNLRITHNKVDHSVITMETTVKTIAQHVDTIASSVRLLERDKIYFYLSETARNAKRSVNHLSLAHSAVEIPDQEEQQRVREFLEALSAASKQVREVRILGPDLSAKIGGLWERAKAGCKVRVSPAVSNFDIRIQVVDGAKVVIGVGPPAKPSESGFLIESVVLAQLLDSIFLALWNKSKTIEELTVEVVTRQIATVPLAIAQLHHIIMQQLHVSSDHVVDIQRMLEEGDHLVCDGNDVYRVALIDECLKFPDRTKDQVAHVILTSGGNSFDMSLEGLLSFLDLVDSCLVSPQKAPMEITELVKNAGRDIADSSLEKFIAFLSKRPSHVVASEDRPSGSESVGTSSSPTNVHASPQSVIAAQDVNAEGTNNG